MNEYWLVGTRTQTCKFPNFATIQDAVDNAQPGDTILVCPGQYYGALVDKELHFAPYLKGRDMDGKGGKKKKKKAPPKSKGKCMFVFFSFGVLF